MKKIFLVLLIAGLVYWIFYDAYFDKSKGNDRLTELKEKYSKKHIPSVDHSKFAVLNKKFNSPQEVTLACISCHNKAHTEIMKTNHWLWEREDFVKGRGVVYFGKKNALNNFCIGIGGSEQACNRCHVGYGWKDKTFNFKDSSNVDCLACHASAGTYFKGKAMAGYPDPSVDLTKAAKSVGRPTRSNCGTCHFFSGGGNNVKHGDLEKSLFTANRDVDVHLGLDGIDMECVDCHTATHHQMKGRMYSLSSTNRNRLLCEDCHTTTPHKEDILNEHTVKVACQTCHIPEYAKVNKTNTYWDWSKAGKLKNGKPYHVLDKEDNHLYLSIKGSFVWKKHLKPQYVWFNGTAGHYFLGDKFNPDTVLDLNYLYGNYNDKNSKIIPVKIHRTIQIYDPVYKWLIAPKLWGNKKGDSAYWQDFNWDLANKAGMDYHNLPYSGKYAWAKTDMYWPLNHMVSTKDKSVKCIECHTRNNSRLANLTGFYMPGRDHSSLIDTIGWIVILLSLIGVLIHGGIRIYMNYSRKH